jgi:hypothetical protein
MVAASGQGATSSPHQTSPQEETNSFKGIRGWLAVWCVGGIVFHLMCLWAVFGSKTVGVSSEAVNLVIGGLAAFGIFAALCVLLAKPYALRLVFLNFLQWAALLVLVYPVIFLTLSPGATLPWRPIAMFILALGVPWVVWFRYFKVSKRVFATFGRNM